MAASWYLTEGGRESRGSRAGVGTPAALFHMFDTDSLACDKVPATHRSAERSLQSIGNPPLFGNLVAELAAAGHWEAVTNAYCVAEARLNLERKYPDFLGRLEKILDVVRLVPDVPGELCPIRLPEKDRPVFASAIRCGRISG